MKDTALGRNALHWAIMGSQLATIKFMLEELKMSLDETDRTHRNAIQLARDYYKREAMAVIDTFRNNPKTS